MTFLRRIIHENNNLLFYYNVSSSLYFTFRFITTVKTLTHCDHGKLVFEALQRVFPGVFCDCCVSDS